MHFTLVAAAAVAVATASSLSSFATLETVNGDITWQLWNVKSVDTAGNSASLGNFNQTTDYWTAFPCQGQTFIAPSSPAAAELKGLLGQAAKDGLFVLPLLDQALTYVSVQTGAVAGTVKISQPFIIITMGLSPDGQLLAVAMPSQGGNPVANAPFNFLSISPATGVVTVLPANLSDAGGVENCNNAVTPVPQTSSKNGFYAYYEQSMENNMQLGFITLWGTEKPSLILMEVQQTADFVFFPRPIGNTGLYTDDVILYLNGARDSLWTLNITDGTHARVVNVTDSQLEGATMEGLLYDYQSMTATVLASGKQHLGDYYLVTYDLSAPQPSGWTYNATKLGGPITQKHGTVWDLAPRTA